MSDGSDREGSIEAIGSFGDTVEIPPRLASRSGGTTGPTVIFLHGRGQSPALVHEVVPAFMAARIVAPPGGVALRRGATWFENVSVGIAHRESVEAAENRFMAWLDRSVSTGCRPWLCGFSNGGAFAGHLLMRHPERFAGAALLSAPLILPPGTLAPSAASRCSMAGATVTASCRATTSKRPNTTLEVRAALCSRYADTRVGTRSIPRRGGILPCGSPLR